MKPYNEECKKCGHKWLSRINNKPIACPKCKRYDYREEKKEVKENNMKGGDRKQNETKVSTKTKL